MAGSGSQDVGSTLRSHGVAPSPYSIMYGGQPWQMREESGSSFSEAPFLLHARGCIECALKLHASAAFFFLFCLLLFRFSLLFSPWSLLTCFFSRRRGCRFGVRGELGFRRGEAGHRRRRRRPSSVRVVAAPACCCGVLPFRRRLRCRAGYRPCVAVGLLAADPSEAPLRSTR